MPNRVRDGTVSLAAMLAIGAFIVFVVALGFMSTAAYDRATKDYQTSQAYSETQRKFKRRCAGLEGEEIFDCLSEQIEAAREPGRSEEDVQAQKEMARWAWWMLLVTGGIGFGTIAVAYFGVVYVRETLLETRRIGRSQVRAYLSAESAECLITKGWFHCNVTIKNNGQSPAIRTEISAYVAVMLPGGSSRSEESSDPGPQIPAGGTGVVYLSWPVRRIGSDAYRRITEPTPRLDIFCRMKWVDVFDQENITTFLIESGVKDWGAHDGKALSGKIVITNLSPGDYDDG